MLPAVCSAASASAHRVLRTWRALCVIRSIESEISSARVEKSVALPESSSPMLPSSRKEVEEPSTARSRAWAECARGLGDALHLIRDAVHARDRDGVAGHLLGRHAREPLRHLGDAGGRGLRRRRPPGHPAHRGAQSPDHRRHRARHVAELVAAVAADAHGQIARSRSAARPAGSRGSAAPSPRERNTLAPKAAASASTPASSSLPRERASASRSAVSGRTTRIWSSPRSCDTASMCSREGSGGRAEADLGAAQLGPLAERRGGERDAPRSGAPGARRRSRARTDTTASGRPSLAIRLASGAAMALRIRLARRRRPATTRSSRSRNRMRSAPSCSRSDSA